MSSAQTRQTPHQHITPPSSLVTAPLTPPLTVEKQFPQVHRVLALFEEIRAGRHVKRDPWIEFQLVEGDKDEIERRLKQDKVLSGFVQDKKRYVCSKNEGDGD